MINKLIVKSIVFIFISIGVECAESKLPVTGEYWLELQDPNHHHVSLLKPVYHIWLSEWSDVVENFWDFLTIHEERLREEYPILYDPDYFMVWFQEAGQRIPYEAFFAIDEVGGITIATEAEGVLGDGKWMFVQMGEQFYVAREQKFRFHHTSLSGGEAVDSAGTFTIKEGHLAKISLVSGHYKPKVAHGRRCLESLTGLSLDVSQLRITYCVMDGEVVIKKRVTVEEFLANATDEPGEKAERFFVPFTSSCLPAVEKAELFLDEAGGLWVGNSKLSEEDSLCMPAGPIRFASSIKMHGGELTHLIFNTRLEVPSDVAKMKEMIHALLRSGMDLSGVRCRLIVHHEKVQVTYQEVLEL